jgi:hypothetical protein
MSGKTYIVYDIETAGMPIDSFDEARMNCVIRKSMKWHFRP